MPDFNKIKAEYIRGGVSYRKLAGKYGVSFSTLRKTASKEKWTDLRNKTGAKRDTKIAESVASREAAKVDKILTIADMLLDTINEGVADRSLTVDATSIRQLMLSLKDAREIKGEQSELDKQEQMARIEKLRRESATDTESKDIHIVIDSALDDYSN